MNPAARLKIALVLTALVAVIEGVGGYLAHSVTLLSDAAHVAMDVLALGIALAARIHARRPATTRRSYGFARVETIAALANGALLFTVTAFLIVEALHRFSVPELPDGQTMAGIALVGLLINGGVGAVLVFNGTHAHSHGHGHGHAHGHGAPGHGAHASHAPGHGTHSSHAQGSQGHAHAAQALTTDSGGHASGANAHKHEAVEDVPTGSNLNMRAALLHVIGDALGSFAALVGGLVVARTGIAWIDPALSLFVSAIIIAGIIRIAREAIDVLLESVPSHADLNAVRAQFLDIAGIVAVHDLHIWSLSASEHILTAHVVLEDRQVSEASQLLRALENDLRENYAITHVTIQFECDPCEDEAHVICMRTAPT